MDVRSGRNKTENTLIVKACDVTSSHFSCHEDVKCNSLVSILFWSKLKCFDEGRHDFVSVILCVAEGEHKVVSSIETDSL